MKGLESIDDPRLFTPFTIITIITMSDTGNSSIKCIARGLFSELAEAAGEPITALTVHELEQLLFRLEQQFKKSVNDRLGQIRETAAAHTDPTKSEEELKRYRQLLFNAFERVNDNTTRVTNVKSQLAATLLAAKTSAAALLAAEQELAVRSGSLDSRLLAVFQAAAAKKKLQSSRTNTLNIYGDLPDGTNELVLTANVPRKKRKSANTKRKSTNTKRNTKRGCM